MAWGRKQGNEQAAAGEIENILGAASEVRGDLKGDRGFRIDGKVAGNIESGGPVVIGETGHVRGNVQGTDVIVVGKVDGNVTASGHLDVGPKGRVVGDVTARSMRIESGGVFRGTSAMGGSGEADESEDSDSPEEEPAPAAVAAPAPN